MLELILAAAMALHPGQPYAQHTDAKEIQSDSPRQVGPTLVVKTAPPPEAHPCPRSGYTKDEDEVCRQTLATEAQVRIAKKPITQTWVLIIVGVVQSAALILTLLEVSKATRYSGNSAKAAQTAADAALLQAKALIAAERPLIAYERIDFVETEGNGTDSPLGRPPALGNLAVFIHNSGRTAVRVTGYSIKTHFGQLPDKPDYATPRLVSDIVEQGDTAGFGFMGPIRISEEDRDAIFAGDPFFWVYGTVTYLDFLNDVYEVGYAAHWNFARESTDRPQFIFDGPLDYGWMRKIIENGQPA
jgi:hypothetical protein